LGWEMEMSKQGNKIAPTSITIPDVNEFRDLIDDMSKAFNGRRKECDSYEKTRKYVIELVQYALSGVNRGGKVWYGAPGDPGDDWKYILKRRLAMLGYDMVNKCLTTENKEGRISGKKRRQKTTPIQSLTKKIEGSEEIDGLLPEDQQWIENFVKGIVKEFPQLNATTDLILVRRLAYLSFLSENDIKLLKFTDDLTDEIKKIQETLGISGKLRDALRASEETGTIADLVKTYEKNRKNFIEEETKMIKEEIRLLIRMLEREQIEEFSFWVHINIYTGGLPTKDYWTIEKLKKFAEIE